MGARDILTPMPDKTIKLLLLLIALAIFCNAIALLIHPAHTSAMESFTCDGTLKANAYGGTEATIGGYNVDLRCH